jgi:hypothetical protein
MNPRRQTRARTALAVSLLALAALAAACGDDTDEDAGADPIVASDDPGGDTSEVPGGERALGVPEECDAFMFAVVPPDASEIELAPTGFPDPPDGSTLCVTSETMDGSTETADFAYDGDVTEVYAHYESMLGEEWNLERLDGVGGEILSGGTDDVGLEVRSVEGGFRLALVAY